MATVDLGYLCAEQNPVDLVEQIADGQEWSFERPGDDELTMSVAGNWADYQISLNWRTDLETLHIACAFDFRVPDARMNEVHRLLAQINEQLWLGHFDLWANEGLILYRHGLMLNDATATPSQCESLLHAALEACERYYQSFQFVVWAGRNAREALSSSMFETEGHA
ncbi:MAG: YbjN domain-containing protein [Pseudomonadota bacterium]